MPGFAGERGISQFVLSLYPSDEKGFSPTVKIGKVVAKVRVGNVSMQVLSQLDGIADRRVDTTLAGFAVAPDGSVLRYVEIPPGVGIDPRENLINWRARVAEAIKLLQS